MGHAFLPQAFKLEVRGAQRIREPDGRFERLQGFVEKPKFVPEFFALFVMVDEGQGFFCVLGGPAVHAAAGERHGRRELVDGVLDLADIPVNQPDFHPGADFLHGKAETAAQVGAFNIERQSGFEVASQSHFLRTAVRRLDSITILVRLRPERNTKARGDGEENKIPDPETHSQYIRLSDAGTAEQKNTAEKPASIQTIFPRAGNFPALGNQ